MYIKIDDFADFPFSINIYKHLLNTWTKIGNIYRNNQPNNQPNISVVHFSIVSVERIVLNMLSLYISLCNTKIEKK